MNAFLSREMAPLTPAAWEAIDQEAARVLKGNLSARSFVDLEGPLGWDCAAIALGRVEISEKRGKDGVNWGLRQSLALVEMRVPFSVSRWEMDNLDRGAADPDLGAVADAARKAAQFEEKLIYRGNPEAGVYGMLEASSLPVTGIDKKAAGAVDAIAKAVLALQQEGVGGPYELVAGTRLYTALATADINGNAVLPRVLDLLGGGKLRWSPCVECGVLVSSRGGDFELSLGQDFSIGYQHTDGDTIHLFLTETLTFRVLEPAAAVGVQFKA